MSGLASALGALWAFVSQIFDPFCGSVGVFSLFASNTLLACGDSGWGDEIGFGFKVTITLACATLPVGLTIGFLIALAAQSPENPVTLPGLQGTEVDGDLRADSAGNLQLNLALRDDARVDLSLLPLGDGLTLCRKR